MTPETAESEHDDQVKVFGGRMSSALPYFGAGPILLLGAVK